MNRTRERLEAAWATKSERPLAVGTYSISLLAKVSAGAYARRLISNEPSDFPAFLGFSGNAMGEKLLDAAGVPSDSREFNLHFGLGGIALSGHPDGIVQDDEAKTVTVLESKRLTFPTPDAIEKATRQALCYAAMFRTALVVRRGQGESHAEFSYPSWFKAAPSKIGFPVELADYAFNVQVVVAGAFEGEIHDVPASPELLGEVLQEFYAKAQAIHASALAGNTDAAEAWDRKAAKERPVTEWAESPEAVTNLLPLLAEAKARAEAAESEEEKIRAELRDAMRAANLTKAVGSGLSASWVQKKTTDPEAVAQFVAAAGKKVSDFEVERVVREVDQAALDAFLASNGMPMENFKTKVYQESFVVRAAGRKKQ